MIKRILTYLRGQSLGLVAIFIALGGTSWAALNIPAHSITRRDLRSGAVGTRQLAKRSVGDRQLKTRAVTERALSYASVGSRQLRNASVHGQQLAPGAVGSSQLAPASVGPADLGVGIGAYIAAYAQVGSDGRVGFSSPTASTTGWSNGSGTVNFAGTIPDGCSALANANFLNSYVQASALPASNGPPAQVNVQTSSPTSNPVIVLVICPAS